MSKYTFKPLFVALFLTPLLSQASPLDDVNNYDQLIKVAKNYESGLFKKYLVDKDMAFSGIYGNDSRERNEDFPNFSILTIYNQDLTPVTINPESGDGETLYLASYPKPNTAIKSPPAIDIWSSVTFNAPVTIKGGTRANFGKAINIGGFEAYGRFKPFPKDYIANVIFNRDLNINNRQIYYDDLTWSPSAYEKLSNTELLDGIAAGDAHIETRANFDMNFGRLKLNTSDFLMKGVNKRIRLKGNVILLVNSKIEINPDGGNVLDISNSDRFWPGRPITVNLSGPKTSLRLVVDHPESKVNLRIEHEKRLGQEDFNIDVRNQNTKAHLQFALREDSDYVYLPSYGHLKVEDKAKLVLEYPATFVQHVPEATLHQGIFEISPDFHGDLKVYPFIARMTSLTGSGVLELPYDGKPPIDVDLYNKSKPKIQALPVALVLLTQVKGDFNVAINPIRGTRDYYQGFVVPVAFQGSEIADASDDVKVQYTDAQFNELFKALTALNAQGERVVFPKAYTIDALYNYRYQLVPKRYIKGENPLTDKMLGSPVSRDFTEVLEKIKARYPIVWEASQPEQLDPETNPTDLVKTTMAQAKANFLILQGLNDTVYQRLGDLRYFSKNDKKTGVWTRVKSNKSSLSGPFAFKTQWRSVELGVDRSWRTNDRKTVFGFSLSAGKVRYEDDRLNTNNKLTGLGLYASVVGDNQWYVDLVGRFAKMGTQGSMIKIDDITGLQYRMLEQTPLNKPLLINASVEAGKRWEWHQHDYLEPQAQLSFAYMGAQRYSLREDLEDGTANFWNGQSAPSMSIVARLGLAVEHEWRNANDQWTGNAYWRVNFNQELLGKYGIKLSNAKGHEYALEPDLRLIHHDHRHWFATDVGFTKNLGQHWLVHAGLGMQFKGIVDKSLTWDVGVRYQF